MGIVDADAIDAALVAAGLLRITVRSTLGPAPSEAPRWPTEEAPSE
jgi:hypothetical protein